MTRFDDTVPDSLLPVGPDRTSRAKWRGLIVALAACFGVSVLGGLLTSTSVGTWYQAIERPSWTPPGWVFGPVWTTLYAMMALGVWDVWRGPQPSGRALIVFGIQLGLNLAWSAVFFGLRSPGLALVEIGLLLIAIATTITVFWRIRRRAALLLIPYFLWTSFAAALNAAIWWLNRV